MDGKGTAGETETVEDSASPSPKEPSRTDDAKLNTKLEKLDSLVEKGAQLATTLLQDTRLSLQRGLPGKIENLLIRQSTLEACKPIHERIRSYVRKRVPPSEVHIIELELTELMSRVAQSEKDRAEADIRLLQEQKRAEAEAERHALEVDRLEKRVQEAVDYERKKGESALYNLRQDMLRLELEKMRVTSEAARERSSWELAEETRRKKHREFLVAEADQKARARVEAIREESEASARFTEERFAERLAAECARMRIEITASLQAELFQEKQRIEARAKSELARLSAPFASVHNACNLLQKENADLRQACENLLRLLGERDAQLQQVQSEARKREEKSSEVEKSRRQALKEKIIALEAQHGFLEKRNDELMAKVEQQRLESNASFYRSRLKLRGAVVPSGDSEDNELNESDNTLQLHLALDRADHEKTPNVAAMLESKSCDSNIEAKWFGRLSTPRQGAKPYRSMEERIRAVALSKTGKVARGVDEIDNGEVVEVPLDKQASEGLQSQRSNLNNLLSSWAIEGKPPTPASQPATEPAPERSLQGVRSLISRPKRLQDLLEAQQEGDKQNDEGGGDQNREEDEELANKQVGEMVEAQGRKQNEEQVRDKNGSTNKPLGHLLEAWDM